MPLPPQERFAQSVQRRLDEVARVVGTPATLFSSFDPDGAMEFDAPGGRTYMGTRGNATDACPTGIAGPIQ